jgi:MscS family membrane protein
VSNRTKVRHGFALTIVPWITPFGHAAASVELYDQFRDILRPGQIMHWKTEMEEGMSLLKRGSLLIRRLLLVTLLTVGAAVSAQEAPVPAEPVVVADEYNRGTPLGSAGGFLAATDANDFETASEFLDLRNLRGAATQFTGAQLARRLDVIIERALWVDVADLVADPDGRKDDGLPAYRDSIGVVLDGSKEVQLLMQKVPRGDGEFIWKISNSTVSQIPALYDTYGYSEIVDRLRLRLPVVSFLGIELFKWVAAISASVAVFGVVLLIAVAARRITGNPNKSSHRHFFRFLTRPVAIGAVVLTMNAVITSLGFGNTADTINRLSPLSPLITVWVFFAGIDLFREIYSDVLLDKGRPGVQVLLAPISNALKLLVLVGGVLFYLDRLGVNITTLLAGLGVGGVAVALALQKPMEDMFGAITLYTQQPVRVGDFCKIGDTVGTIEEIGLRTTSFRTLANTLIAVPNSRLASEAIDNISRRQKILYRATLRIHHDSTAAQVRELMDDILAALDSDERVLEGHRVRFVSIAETSLEIEVFTYFDTSDWAEYLELAEGLNFRILGLIENSGTKLAFPFRTLHFDSGD